jgi:hypothetical protein
MAKNRNKKNRAKSGGLAAMDTSEGGPATSTAADVPQRTFPLSISFISYGCFLCSPPFGFYDVSVHDILFFVWQQWIRPRESSHRHHRGARFDQQVS